jgi:hypothetical protein
MSSTARIPYPAQIQNSQASLFSMLVHPNQIRTPFASDSASYLSQTARTLLDTVLLNSSLPMPQGKQAFQALVHRVSSNPGLSSINVASPIRHHADLIAKDQSISKLLVNQLGFSVEDRTFHIAGNLNLKSEPGFVSLCTFLLAFQQTFDLGEQNNNFLKLRK